MWATNICLRITQKHEISEHLKALFDVLFTYMLRSVINFALRLTGSFPKEKNTASGIPFEKELFYLLPKRFMLGFYDFFLCYSKFR